MESYRSKENKAISNTFLNADLYRESDSQDYPLNQLSCFSDFNIFLYTYSPWGSRKSVTPAQAWALGEVHGERKASPCHVRLNSLGQLGSASAEGNQALSALVTQHWLRLGEGAPKHGWSPRLAFLRNAIVPAKRVEQSQGCPSPCCWLLFEN